MFTWSGEIDEIHVIFVIQKSIHLVIQSITIADLISQVDNNLIICFLLIFNLTTCSKNKGMGKVNIDLGGGGGIKQIVRR